MRGEHRQIKISANGRTQTKRYATARRRRKKHVNIHSHLCPLFAHDDHWPRIQSN